MADLDTLRMLAEQLRNDGYRTGALEEASDAILALLDENEKLRAAMTCLWIISDDDHPEYPGEHGIDTVMEMVRAVLAHP